MIASSAIRFVLVLLNIIDGASHEKRKYQYWNLMMCSCKIGGWNMSEQAQTTQPGTVQVRFFSVQRAVLQAIGKARASSQI